MAAERISGDIDLLEKILIRLPAKSLGRFKAVNKQWLSHISNPQFVQSHCCRRPNNSATGMFLSDPRYVDRNAQIFIPINALNPTYQTTPSLDFLYNGLAQLETGHLKAKIYNSCNGLLLCDSGLSSHQLVVVNPTTKNFRLLPKIAYQDSSFWISYLAFDPSVSPHYKVVCVESLSHDDDYDDDDDHGDDDACWETTKYHVYSSDDPCWRTHEHPFDPEETTGFFWNGFIYWLDYRHPRRFNVHTAELKPVIMAPNSNDYSWLSVSDGHLFFAGESEDGTRGFLLLEMNTDFSKCVAKYDVRLTGLDINGRVSRYSAVCVVCGGEEEEEVVAVVIEISGKVILYDLKQRIGKELYTMGGEMGFNDRLGQSVHLFVESLAVV